MTKTSSFMLIFCLLLCFSCGSGEQETSATNTLSAASPEQSSQDEATPAADLAEEESEAQSDQVLAWVDNLNIREQANIKSKVVAQVKENESLTLTGKKTDFTETIELRGTFYTEPWIEVKTADGKTGWVFQGAVKRPGEEKGNALNTANKFTYPHFGTFDLTTWKKMASRNDSDSEELDIMTDIYQKTGQSLEITDSDMGEFFWEKSYRLLDANKKVLKERKLTFTVDPLTLTETVKDFNINPPKQYMRAQSQKQHWYQMKAKPDMASGEWKVSPL